MEDRTTDAAIERFIMSAAGVDLVQQGYEAPFRAELQELMRSTDLSGLAEEMPTSTDGDQEIDTFLDYMIADGYVEHPDLMIELLRTVEVGLQARYDTEVGRDEPERSPLASLTAHVQAFVQAVKDFVRGRELEESTQEHGSER